MHTDTGRSVSGVVTMLGKHTLSTWSTTQPTVAWSSAEVEYYALVEGATRGLGLKTMLGEIGVQVDIIVVFADSSSAKSFASLQWLITTRHVECKKLWLQETVWRGRVIFEFGRRKNAG